MIKYKGKKDCSTSGCNTQVNRGMDKWGNIRHYCHNCYEKVRIVEKLTYFKAQDGTKIPLNRVKSRFGGFRDYTTNDTTYRYCKECKEWKIISEYADYGSGKRKICKNCK